MKRNKNTVALYADKNTVNIYKASLDMYEALKELIDFNWMNKGNDGKTCPHPIEFIACYTFGAGNIPEVYRKADQALAKAQGKGG